MEASEQAVSVPQPGAMGDELYVRYYVGHKGKFGHEFLEFEFQSDGKVGWDDVARVWGGMGVSKQRWPRTAAGV